MEKIKDDEKENLDLPDLPDLIKLAKDRCLTNFDEHLMKRLTEEVKKEEKEKREEAEKCACHS